MQPDTNRRGRLLYVALGFLGLDVPPAVQPSGLVALHAWLDTWHGIGLIEQGLARQDRDARSSATAPGGAGRSS